jgi:hypothetical protein
MQVVYANQAPPESWTSAIFLAGPTPRKHTTLPSWRPNAIQILAEMGYEGVVFVPEDETGEWQHSYDDQVDWEEMCLNLADVIVFWVPRNIEQMPAFTTNDEWGYWKSKDPAKLVLGTPEDAPKVKYQRNYAEKLNIPTYNTLKGTCIEALNKIGDGAMRSGGERHVPLHIWRTPAFVRWYNNLKAAGNRLDGAKVEWVFRVGPNQSFIFFWIMHVDVHIEAEKRNKRNEVILARPDIATIVLYERLENMLDSRIVLVKEFRSPVSNESGYVYEVAGGSSWKEEQNPRVIAADECFEEVGLRLNASRFVEHGSRQLSATSLTHHAHLFSSQLTSFEMDEVVANAHVVRGVEADTERTWAEVYTYREILERRDIDWSMLGMISFVLNG